MNVNALTRRLTAVALAGVVGLALAAGPATAQEAEGQEAAARQAGGEAEAQEQAQEQPRQIQMKILGMSCPFCAYGVEQKLKRLEGVKELDIQLESGIGTLVMEEGADVSNERLRGVIEDAGFEAAAIVRSFESEFEDWNPEEMPREEGSGKTG